MEATIEMQSDCLETFKALATVEDILLIMDSAPVNSSDLAFLVEAEVFGLEFDWTDLEDIRAIIKMVLSRRQ